MISSNDQLEKTTGLSTLISLSGVANESSLNTIAVHFLQLVSLRNIPSKDEEIVILASIALGKLLSAPTTTTFELADEEFRYALNTLKNDVGFPRFAACCEIKEVAQRLPILFAVYLGEFFNVIWNALRDPKEHIRDAGLQTFILALKQMETREDLFEKVLGDCLKGLQSDNSLPVILGSLMVLKELLDRQTSLLIPHILSIGVIVAKNKDHKTLVIKQAFLDIMPSYISFVYKQKSADKKICDSLTDYVIKVINSNSKDQKNDAIVTLGQIAVITEKNFVNYASQCVSIVNAEFKKKPFLTSIFELLRGITKSLGPKISEYIDIGSNIPIVIFI